MFYKSNSLRYANTFLKFLMNQNTAKNHLQYTKWECIMEKYSLPRIYRIQHKGNCVVDHKACFDYEKQDADHSYNAVICGEIISGSGSEGAE